MMKLLTEIEVQSLISSMTDQEVVFCHEYAIDGNKLRAIRKSGCADLTHSSQYAAASRLLAKERVRELIAHLRAETLEKAKITAEMIISEVARLAFSDLSDVSDFTDSGFRVKTYDQMGDSVKTVKKLKENITLAGTTIELEIHDRMKALELLGKYDGIWQENINLKNNGGSFDTPPVEIFVNHRKPGEKIT